MATVNLGRIKPVWQGAWNSSTQYVVEDIVQYNNHAWVATTTNTNSAPADGNSNWDLMARGLDGTGSTNGQILTADGTGSYAWETPAPSDNASALTQGTLSVDRMPSGSVIAVHAVVNSTRTDISGTGVRAYTWGTFNKVRANSNLVFSGTLLFNDSANNDSDATGLYVQFQTPSMGSGHKVRGLSRIDVTGTNFEERFAQTTGYIAGSSVNHAETVTVTWGTDQSGSYIANIWNPNSTDDSRYGGQRESTLLVWEVAP